MLIGWLLMPKKQDEAGEKNVFRILRNVFQSPVGELNAKTVDRKAGYNLVSANSWMSI